MNLPRQNRLFVIAISLIMVMGAAGAAYANSPAQRETNGIIAFISDWGTRDFFVGAAKGVAYSVFPEARIVDISHEVEPYDIMEGAVTLLLSAREFPAGTVFLAVVDPGVGTDRRPIAVKTLDGRIFVGPDNGLFTLVIQEFGLAEARQISSKDFMRPGRISYEFHGRDIFAPAAANLAAGRRFEDIGPVVDDIVKFDIHPASVENGKACGQVIVISQYGNMVANITRNHLDSLGLKFGDKVTVQVGDTTVDSTVVNTYGDVPEGDDLVFADSTDFLQIAINMGNASEKFGAEIGSPVAIWKAK